MDIVNVFEVFSLTEKMAKIHDSRLESPLCKMTAVKSKTVR